MCLRDVACYSCNTSSQISQKAGMKMKKIIIEFIKVIYLMIKIGELLCNTGQSVPSPRHSQTRAKNADLVAMET